ncbi:hypothetical protein BC835DRAFT_1404175 [Cytidiella melzeri]|nr:hypothetical protein BC835DRAFT_1404175 [Cytidiella melzeri]
MSDEEKACLVLQYMRDNLSRFLLRQFLKTCFSSENSEIRNFTGTFMEDGGAVCLMDLWSIVDWVMDRAGEECEKECSALTDRVSSGPHKMEAEALRIPVHTDFSYRHLSDCYDALTPQLQQLLKAAIGNSGKPAKAASRNPDDGQATITSMLLNLRSRQVNYHASVNTLMLWQLGASEQLVQILNRVGFCSSYKYQSRAVVYLGTSALWLACIAACDRDKIKELAYDNFNWRDHACCVKLCLRDTWEVSATHGIVQHDQVSALLIILDREAFCASGPTLSVQHLMSMQRFDENFGSRHRLPMEESLQRIIPTSDDHLSFFRFRKVVPSFDNPHAIPPQKTEQYWLPTYDQEQGSTRGNMQVLEHYLLDVLQMPRDLFETDGLVRALDCSSNRVDHLSSIQLTSGMMHQCLNMVINMGQNSFGDKSTHDLVSLYTLRSHLPNCESLNLKKLNVCDMASLDSVTENFTALDFASLCTTIAERFILPSLSVLEAEEMRHAIKHGHPTRMLRMLKYWTPMFYAGGSYNYSNEDWPSNLAHVILAGMLVNTTGRKDGFKEGDLDVEHLNKSIKGRAHGANASAGLLEKVTPALGHVQQLTQQVSQQLGLDELNQQHSHVGQEKDIELLVKRFLKAKVFSFADDKKSTQVVSSLFHDRLTKLTSTNGGHARHLAQHKLRLHTCHSFTETENMLMDKLNNALDATTVDYVIDSEDIGPNFQLRLGFVAVELIGSLTHSLDL